MKLFVGLGNPDSKFLRNRHNVGFMALDRVAKISSFGPWRNRCCSLLATGDLSGERILLAKPQTYYNSSGSSVYRLAHYFKVSLSDIIVFHDEIDLPLGKLRVKRSGGLAGNKGLKSIQEQFCSTDFTRVRIGVGHPGEKSKVASFVLHHFKKSETAWLSVLLDAVVDSIDRIAVGQIDRFQSDVAESMSLFHSRNANCLSPDKDCTST